MALFPRSKSSTCPSQGGSPNPPACGTVKKSSLAPPQPSQTHLVATLKTIGPAEIHAAIERLATAISARYRGEKKPLLLGIANGGLELTCRLARRLNFPTGTVDISFHRDDIGRHPIPKEFAPSHIPGDIQGATVILVDDVLFSGRTVKAALDELFDHGRPAKVELAVLADRGDRLLPIAADYTGLTVQAGPQEKVVVALDVTDAAHDIIRVIAIQNRKSTL